MSGTTIQGPPPGENRYPIDHTDFNQVKLVTLGPSPEGGELDPAPREPGGASVGQPIRPTRVTSDSPVRDVIHSGDGSGQIIAKHWAQAAKDHPALVSDDPKVQKAAVELADKILDPKHKLTALQAEVFMARHPELKETLSKPSIDLIFKAKKSDDLAKAMAEADPKLGMIKAHELADFTVAHRGDLAVVRAVDQFTGG